MIIPILLGAAPVASATAAAIVVAVRRPGPQLRSGIQHFAGGLVMTAVATEVLPDVLGQPLRVPMIGVAWASARCSGSVGSSVSSPVRSVEGCRSACSSSRRLILPWTGSSTVSGSLGIALAVEAFFLSLSVALEVGTRLKRAAFIGLTIAVALPLPVTLAATMLLLAGLPDIVFATVLAFAAVSLLYLVTEELLVEAHKARETPITVSLFFVGLLAFVILEGIASG